MNENRKEGASYSPNYIEYLVPVRKSTTLMIRKICLIIFITILLMGSIVITLKFPWILTVLLILIFIIAWYASRFVNLEYEYVIASGEMEMDVIYGQRQRRKIMNAKIRDMEIIAPAEERYLNQIKKNEVTKTIFAASDMNSPNTYFCVYKDKNGTKTLMYFEAIKKSVDIMRFYNSGATIISDKLTH